MTGVISFKTTHDKSVDCQGVSNSGLSASPVCKIDREIIKPHDNVFPWEMSLDDTRVTSRAHQNSSLQFNLQT
jgi:hypothetical protein